MWYALSLSWRFLFGLQLPHAGHTTKEATSKVQELEVWTPSEMETELFSIYSPAHALLWLAIGSTNWLLSILIMGLVSLQVCRRNSSKNKYFLIIFTAERIVTCVYPALERQTNSCCRDNERIQWYGQTLYTFVAVQLCTYSVTLIVCIPSHQSNSPWCSSNDTSIGGGQCLGKIDSIPSMSSCYTFD